MKQDIWDSSGDELVLLASSIAIGLGKQYNADDLNTIGNFLSAIGELVSLLATQKNRAENSNNNNNNNNNNNSNSNNNTTNNNTTNNNTTNNSANNNNNISNSNDNKK